MNHAHSRGFALVSGFLRTEKQLPPELTLVRAFISKVMESRLYTNNGLSRTTKT